MMPSEDILLANTFEEACLSKDNKYDLIILFMEFSNKKHPSARALEMMNNVLQEQKKRVAMWRKFQFSFENTCTEQGKNTIVKELTNFLKSKGYSFGNIKATKI